MDDLDHSIHIAEYDWSSFYDESEECDLLQPSLAYSDDYGLSDPEDSGNSGSVYSYGQTASHDAERNTAEESCARSAKQEEQLNQRVNRGPVNEDATGGKQVEMCVSYPIIDKEAVHMEVAQKITETSDSSSKTLQNSPLNVQCSGETKEQTQDRILQRESDLKSTKEPDPLLSNQIGESVGELDATEGAVSVMKAEKERWFVTLNDNPTRQLRRSTALKKKRKIKKTCEGGPTWSLRKENSAGNGVELNKDKHKSNQTKKPGRRHYGQIKAVRVISDSPEKCLIPQFFTENISQKAISRRKCESDNLAFTSEDTCTPQQAEHVQSDQLEDDFLSMHSYDSETYLSAAESTEDTHHLIEYTQSSLSPACDGLTDDTDQAKGRQMFPLERAFSSHIADCEDHKSPRCESSVTFPSVGHEAIKTPDDESTCKNDTPAETSGSQKLLANLSASACSQGDQLDRLSAPNLTVSHCSAADNPETFAKAAGHSQPIYAISAFWDEMEKLTINDILQLRKGKISPARQTQDTATPNADDFSPNPCSDVEDVEYDLANSVLMDTSDTADSDYFTQTDESKPDHSSCEFFTSDFEEEYCQFIRSSKNPKPYHNSTDQQANSPFLSHEDDSTNSEGRKTPVPLEDVGGQLFENQQSQIFTSLPRRLTKSNSVYNVQALNTEDLSLLSLLSHDSSLSISRPLPLEEDMDFKNSGGLGTLIPASFSSNTELLHAHYQISFPEMFEYLFTEDNTTTKSQYVAICDPKDISVVSVFDHNLCAFGENASLPFPLQHSMEKSIPIFSYSHPTVRELTFPKQDYFLSEVDNIPPFRVVSNSFNQTDLLGCSAVVGGGLHRWNSLLPVRKISFHDKGSIWCRGSGAWMFPFENEEIPVRRENQPAELYEGRICPASSQVYRKLKEQQQILETVCIKREGFFSSVKQSDMCLVCIAFASWVLRSSDPDGADSWKAALLANVSALSAIQYLRQYVKKKDPSDDL